MLIEFHDAVESFRSIMVELENSMYEKDAHQLEEVRKRSIQLHTCLKVYYAQYFRILLELT